MKKNRGFTLLEIVIAITLMSVLLIMLFRSFTVIQNTSEKVQEKRDLEKKIYLFSNYMANLCKNMSHVYVNNNVTRTKYFRGGKNEMTFISRNPVIYSYPIPHHVNLKFSDDRIEYREKIFLESGKEPVTFEFSDSPYEILLTNIKEPKLYYQIWEKKTEKYIWKKEINTYENDPFPERVLIEFTFTRKVYRFQFKGFIYDK